MSAVVAWVLVGIIVSVQCLPAVLENNRQTGQTNYQGNIQDVLVAFVYDEVMEESDYYDYSDLTVKPEEAIATSTASSSLEPKPESETSPLGSSTVPSVTAVLINGTEQVAPTEDPKPAASPASSSGPQHPLNTHNMQIPVVVVTDHHKKKGYISSSSIRNKNGSNIPEVESLPRRTCSPGFVLDDKNRCRRAKKPALVKHRPPLPYGLRYAQRPEAAVPDQTT